MGVLEERQVSDENWRREVQTRLDDHFERLEAGDERMSRLEDGLAVNTTVTTQTKANTDELLEIFRAFQGAVQVGRWVGGVLKWVAVVIVAVGVVFWSLKTGELPRKH